MLKKLQRYKGTLGGLFNVVIFLTNYGGGAADV